MVLSFSRILRAYLKLFLKFLLFTYLGCHALLLHALSLVAGTAGLTFLLWSTGSRVHWLHSCDSRALEHRLRAGAPGVLAQWQMGSSKPRTEQFALTWQANTTWFTGGRPRVYLKLC